VLQSFINPFLQDTLVCEATLRALYYLTRNHTSNQARIGTCGGIELIIHSLRSLFYKPNIVYYSCLCVAGLAYRNHDNCVLLDKCEVGNVIVKVLNIYMEQAEVVEAACYAVYALKMLNHRLGEACQVRYFAVDFLSFFLFSKLYVLLYDSLSFDTTLLLANFLTLFSFAYICDMAFLFHF